MTALKALLFLFSLIVGCQEKGNMYNLGTIIAICNNMTSIQSIIKYNHKINLYTFKTYNLFIHLSPNHLTLIRLIKIRHINSFNKL